MKFAEFLTESSNQDVVGDLYNINTDLDFI